MKLKWTRSFENKKLICVSGETGSDQPNAITYVVTFV